jgi:hypothetical protein
MTFLGHFDKMCMKLGEEAMRKEFERLIPSCVTNFFNLSCTSGRTGTHYHATSYGLSNVYLIVKKSVRER